MDRSAAAYIGRGDQMRPLRKDRPAILKEYEEVGGPVEVDVHDRAHRIARGLVEFLDQIDALVEVAVGLAAYEGTAVVVLLNIRSTIEVRIDVDLREPPLTIVQAPDIGTSVVVLIVGADVTAGWPHSHGCSRGARDDAQGSYQRPARPSSHRTIQRTEVDEDSQLLQARENSD